MSNLLDTFEKQQIERLTAKKRIPAFRPGDTLKVTVRITEGSKSRLQAFEGICLRYVWLFSIMFEPPEVIVELFSAIFEPDF